MSTVEPSKIDLMAIHSMPNGSTALEGDMVRGDDEIARDIVVALIRAGVRLVGAQNTDPEAVGSVYGRLFNAVRHTVRYGRP